MEDLHPFSIASLTSPQKPQSCLNKTNLDNIKCRIQSVKNIQEVSQTATDMDITKHRMSGLHLNQYLQQGTATYDKTKAQNGYENDSMLQQTTLSPFVDLMSLGIPDLSMDFSGILDNPSETRSVRTPCSIEPRLLHTPCSAEPRSLHTLSSSLGSNSLHLNLSDSGLGSSLSASSFKEKISLQSLRQQSPGQQSPRQQLFECESKLTDNISSSTLSTKSDENINNSFCGVKAEEKGSIDSSNNMDSISSSSNTNNSSCSNINTNNSSSSDSSSSTSSDDKDSKPCHSYVALISRAILSCPQKQMVLSDIYQHVMDNHIYYNNGQRAWRNSIRHNLSLNECFMKAGRAENGKGHYWCIHPSCLEDFIKGDYRRRHARRRARTLAQRHALNISALPYSYRCNLGYVPMSSSPLAGHSHPMGNLHGNMFPSNSNSPFSGQRSCNSPSTSSPVNHSNHYTMKGYPTSPIIPGHPTSPVLGNPLSLVQGYPSCDVIHGNPGAGYMSQFYTGETHGIQPITAGHHPVTSSPQSTQNSYLQQSSTPVAMNNRPVAMDYLGVSMDTHLLSPYYSRMSHTTSPASRYSPYPTMR